ncbi:FecR domain-containing protein [uncultured Aquimarina sp.]|uniref:FecR family protein n=1 Tax=uncultured Aquimarina sp. TaxID=575652 RepID=UPI002617000A|nr:FecR domain-containing protein [uncultured Aquimarina sp.]
MKSYLTLIEKYLENTISPEDREILKSWVEENEEHKNIFKKEVANWSVAKEEISVDPNKAYDRFVKNIQKGEQEKGKVRSLHSLKKVMQYAAVLAGILVITYYAVKSNPVVITNDNNVVITESLEEDKIKIVQEDGTVTYIDFDDKTDIVNADGKLIGKKDRDKLVVSNTENSEEIEYLEISIPKGKIFQLSLSDGTKVWLNAASTLKFPKNFAASQPNRLVYLEGEAFFDVTTNKEQPFIVNTGTVDVEVLGTQFNVSSYQEDLTVKTTLVEGSVAINNSDDHKKLLTLIPNDQAVYTKQNKDLDKKKVNTEVYTAWMYRKMIIQDESFTSVIKRLERTYDVEIVSTNERLNNTRFTGEFDVENVRQILNVFSETIDFTYTIENKRIVIAP